MNCENIRFSQHAIVRIFKREIPPDVVRRVVVEGEVVADYPDDTPYPSVLMLEFQNGQPVHVVVARDRLSGDCNIITVYRPDPRLWMADYKTRREL